MTVYLIESLPEVDQRELKRGVCPWCLNRLTPGDAIKENKNDSCFECGDEFFGKLTIED